MEGPHGVSMRVLQPGEQEAKEPRARTLFRRLNILNLPIFAVAMPTLANHLSPGMTDRQVPSLFHPGFTGHVSKLQLLDKIVLMASPKYLAFPLLLCSYA